MDVLDAGHGDDVARERALDLHPLEPLPGVDARQLAGRLRAVVPAQHVLAAGGELAGHDPPDGQPADVVVVSEVVRLEARRRVRRVGRAGQEAHDRLEERPQIGALPAELPRRRAGARVGVEHGELELLLARPEIDEQAVDLVEDRRRPGVRAVDLVEADDGRETGLERLAEDEAGLRQRALRGVDQEEHPVDHGERALDLAAEVGMAGRIDDVDVHALPRDRRVLREDRDAALPLEGEGVHHPLGHRLIGAEDAGLPEQRIDERRLPVVDVGDDADVAHVGAAGHGRLARGSAHGHAS